jgi:hypothetical protein
LLIKFLMSKWPFWGLFFFLTHCTSEKILSPIWCDVYLRILETEKVLKAEVTFIEDVDFEKITLLQKPLKKINLPAGGIKFLYSGDYIDQSPLLLAIEKNPPWPLIPGTSESLIMPDSIYSWEEFKPRLSPSLTENEELWLIFSEETGKNFTLKYHGTPLNLKDDFSPPAETTHWNIQPVRKKISAIEQPNFLGQFTSEYYGRTHWLKFLSLHSNSTKQ